MSLHILYITSQSFDSKSSMIIKEDLQLLIASDYIQIIRLIENN